MAETARQTARAESDDGLRIDFLIYFTIDRSHTHARTVVLMGTTSSTYSRSKAKQEKPNKQTGTHHHHCHEPCMFLFLALFCAKKKDLLIDESSGYTCLYVCISECMLDIGTYGRPYQLSSSGYLQLAGHASIFACTEKKMMVVHLLHWPNHAYLLAGGQEVERITNNVHAVQQNSGQQQTIASEALDYIQAPSIRLLRLR